MSVILDQNFSSEVSSSSKTPITGSQSSGYPNVLTHVLPARCRPWKYHNRDKAWLIKERCMDLILSIQQNGQIEPTVVRRVVGDPHCEYEIICGVRRWFACTQIPNQKLLACVTEADDKTCMILMHSENADSRDISEFERAFSFAEQSKSGLFKSQTEMAEAVGVSQGTISKMIKAAEIFEYDWIRVLFRDKLGISVKHAYALSILLKNPESHPLIKEEALIIKKEMEKTKSFYSASKVLRRLTRRRDLDLKIAKEATILALGNKSIVSCRQDKFGKFYVVIDKKARRLNYDEIEQACVKAIREYVFN